ncbi:MAG: hypothetical protein IJT91_07030 [Clostridia bacterium]|nr:hypothetical protein [Clostridia bacterium]
MPKWCFNYESGEYEYIDRNGFSIDRGEYVYNWDDSEYRREEREREEEEEEEKRRRDGNNLL